MMNPRTNKKRPTSNRGGRGKGMEKQMFLDGVYANYHFLHTVGLLVGLPVQVLTKTKELYEGVLNTIGPEFTLSLDLPHSVVSSDTSIISNPESVRTKIVFKATDIVMIKVINVDLDFATREGFAIDSAISKFNGQNLQEKELEPWMEEEGNEQSLGLGDGNANGWDADAMFKKNEEEYGVTTTYTPDMEGYTTPLQKRNTQEWKEQEARAQRIASEIESSPATRIRSDLENGDEEQRFSAVVRPTSDAPSMGKYMPPQRRKIQGDLGTNQGPPSKSHGHAGPPPSGGHRYSNSPMGQSPRYLEASGQMRPSPTGPSVSPQYSHPSQPLHRTGPPHSQAASTPPHASGQDSKVNGETKESRRSVEPGPNLSRESSVPKEIHHPVEPPITHPPPHHQPHHPHQSPHAHPPVSHPHQTPPPSVSHPTPVAHPPPHSHHNTAMGQSQTYNSDHHHRKQLMSEKDRQNPNFKQFRNEFKLPDSSFVDKKGPPPPVSQSREVYSLPTSVPPPTHVLNQPPPPIQPSESPSSGPPPVEPIPNSSTPVSSSNPPTPQPKSSDVEGSAEKASSSSSVSGSKLNPNAKEFVFNPNAKPFSPRSPSTSTPPRAQTPQIVHTAATPIAPVGFPQNMVHAYVMAPQQFQMQAQPRFQKRAPVSNPRPDYVSSMQVANATGTPILAPTPLTPITAPQTSALHRVPMPQNVVPQAHQPYPCQGVPMMVPLHPSGFPMVTTMVPTSGMYYQGGEAPQQGNVQGHNAHQHMYVATQGVHSHQHQSQQHHASNAGPHPGQPPTPQGPGNSGGPHSMPNQPPTPGPTPPQTMIYTGPGHSQMAGQLAAVPQGMGPPSSQHAHNPYANHNAALAAAAVAAHHQTAAAPQLVVIPPHMAPHMVGHANAHSGPGHTPVSAAPYTVTSAGAMQQHMTHAHPVQYIPGGGGGQVHQIPVVHPNQ